MENQVGDHLKKKEWLRALDATNAVLGQPQKTELEIYTHWLERLLCLFELGRHENVIEDCKHLLRGLSGHLRGDEESCDSRIRTYLIRSLFALNRPKEAELVVKDWQLRTKYVTCRDHRLYLDKTLYHFHFLTTPQALTQWLATLDTQTTRFRLEYVDDNKNRPPPTATNNNNNSNGNNTCIYCNVSFGNKADLGAHCASREHESVIMSDEGRDWQWRAPPRGFKAESYSLCSSFCDSGGNCRFGGQCVDAHGEAELAEWRERFQYREMKILRAREKELYGKSYTESLLEKWEQTPTSCHLMRADKIDHVTELVQNQPLSTTVTSKTSTHRWQFAFRTPKQLKAVALLQDTHRSHFHIAAVIADNCNCQLSRNGQEFVTGGNNGNTVNGHCYGNGGDEAAHIYRVDVVFNTRIFGTFRQSVVFDFGTEPLLVKHLCVDVIPGSDLNRIEEIRRDITFSIQDRWTSDNSEIVNFESSNQTGRSEWERGLLALYPSPQGDHFQLSNATTNDHKYTKNNYRMRVHELLTIEEITRYNLIARYNLSCRLQIAHSYLLAPDSRAASTAKYSSDGELFASISLGLDLSEDKEEGRLILMHCNSVLLLANPTSDAKTKIYEAQIEDKGKNTIYLRLSRAFVRDLNLTPDTDLDCQIQFQLNRLPYCEWHYTVDKIKDFAVIFPETYLEPSIPWSPSRQWSQSLDKRLNLKQKEAVVAITTPLSTRLPPILVIGPFGTGKTFTLAQAVKELIKDGETKILLCTHSNSAADLYIRDYFDRWVEQEGLEEARPLRIYYQKRWVATVSPVVQKYCRIVTTGQHREFQLPTIDDIHKHRIIVVTLSTSIYLSAMGLPGGTFTHILLDEAAQALECETITPLALATRKTRIVLAGDHMQLGPDIFSRFAKDRNFHISLLERLYDHYPPQFPCKVLLCENYRAHETIIQFASDSFYDQKLVASSKQPPHSRFHPLSFFTSKGEDIQDQNSTAYYNVAEVYEVVERVCELKNNWPTEWGEFHSDCSIGVVAPYSDQVFRIRAELRKRRVDVCVERVLNIQGKQFRAIVLSTVRTRRTCCATAADTDHCYGFLSNSKLLNTAITRAQSLVAVVGDPIALCSLGRCSKVWERFVQTCHENGSLFGITWSELKCQLDGIELKKIYTLNPLAPEFVPRNSRNLVGVSLVTLATPTAPPIPLVPYYHHHHPPPPPPPPPLIYHHHHHQRHPSPSYVALRPVRLLRPMVPRPPLMPPNNCNNNNSNNRMAQPPHLIQFMNNVHFPQNKQQQHTLSDCISLLPQQMSLAEMLAQPPAIQERWCRHLAETAGGEAADRFRFLLHATNQKGSRVMPSGDPHLFSGLSPASCDSPSFNWYDSPQNQVNVNKPIYMRDDEQTVAVYQRPGPYPASDASASSSRSSNSSVNLDEVQRHVNEEFSKLTFDGEVLDGLFQSLASVGSNGGDCVGAESSGGRFSKYFS